MTAADYGAIAVAPVLIFLMIGSLANFLMLLGYSGGYPTRGAWIVWFFTMGTVALARVAIENSRSYSLGYALALGLAGLLVLGGMFGNPILAAVVLLTIGVLADRITHDCTIIDDKQDASGWGLFGSRPTSRKGRKQPGRTVLYLALAALPLFGLGQLAIRSPDAEKVGLWYLALYLFASLSLLVTTSFLSLRRYLRQRGAEMPGDVTVGWLVGGTALVAVLLVVAYLIPMPGQRVASVDLDSWISTADDWTASRFGWGDETAPEESGSDPNRVTKSDPQADQDSAPEGDATGQGDSANQSDATGDGEPAGEGDARDQEGDAKRQSESSESEKRSGEQQASRNENSSEGESSGGDEPSDGGESSDASESSDGSESDNQEGSGEQKPSGEQDASNKQDASGEQSESRDGESSDDTPRNEPDRSSRDEPSGDTTSGEESSGETPSGDDPSGDDPSGDDPSGDDPSDESPSQDASSSSSTDRSPLSGLLSGLSDVFRFLLILLLLGIVAAFLWVYRDQIARWWSDLWGRPKPDPTDDAAAKSTAAREPPPRPFSSYRNPIGREQDPRRVIVITFQAFEAWTREHGWRRSRDETPNEFATRVAAEIPEMSGPARQVIDAYNRVVYGRGRATGRDVEAAGEVWNAMRRSPQPRETAAAESN